MQRHVPSVGDGREALRDHLVEKASLARARYGPSIDAESITRLLRDPVFVRYPVELAFDVSRLQPGEFAFAEQLTEHPAGGFRLWLHPCFEGRPSEWPALIAYHIPPINYGDIVTCEDCEVFGATLLGMQQEPYYRLLCALADSIADRAEK